MKLGLQARFNLSKRSIRARSASVRSFIVPKTRFSRPRKMSRSMPMRSKISRMIDSFYALTWIRYLLLGLSYEKRPTNLILSP